MVSIPIEFSKVSSFLPFLELSLIVRSQYAGESIAELRAQVVDPIPVPEPTLAQYLKLREMTYSNLSTQELSRSTWVNVGDDIFILTGVTDRSYARIEVDSSDGDSHWNSTFMRDLGTRSTPSRFHQPIHIAFDTDLQKLFRSTDTFLRHSSVMKENPPRRNASWRSRAISASQLRFITRKIALPLQDSGDWLDDHLETRIDLETETRVIPGEWVDKTGLVLIKDLTSGEAANVITRQINGFGGRLKRARVALSKELRSTARLRKSALSLFRRDENCTDRLSSRFAAVR